MPVQDRSDIPEAPVRNLATCAYQKGLPHPCGKTAIAAVKISKPAPEQIDLNMTINGLIVGSCYLPVCYEHMQLFPDYEGIHLTTA